jgi:hypothetical protein
MKTNKKYFKRLAAISSVALLAVASPVFAQTSGAPDASQQGRDAQSQRSSGPPANQSDQYTGIEMDEPAGAELGQNNWGWVGLFGLAGLFGLKRHRDTYDRDQRTARA